MIKSENVRAGRALLEDSLMGLARKLNLSSPEVKAGAAYKELATRALALTQRVRVGMAGWNKLSQLGVPYYIQYSDLCMQQLEQWSSELQVLWDKWAELTGETKTTIAKPRERMLKLGSTSLLSGAFGGASSVLWALVALGVLGLVAMVVWRRA
jgi:hypothetical protein